MNGAELLLARQAHGMSLTDMSRWLDVDERTIRRWERDEFPTPAGVASEVRGLPDLIDKTAARIANTWHIAQSLGLDSIGLPKDHTDLPKDLQDVPLAVYLAALWQAHLEDGVPITTTPRRAQN